MSSSCLQWVDPTPLTDGADWTSRPNPGRFHVMLNGRTGAWRGEGPFKRITERFRPRPDDDVIDRLTDFLFLIPAMIPAD